MLSVAISACSDDDDNTATTEAGTDDATDAGDDSTADDDTDDDDTDDTDDDTDDDTSDDGGIPNLHEIPDSGDPGVIMCAELGTLCHAYDEGDGELGDVCHDTGHFGDPEACAEIYDECIAFCQEPPDAGDGPHGGDHDGGSAMCEDLGHLCHDFDTGEGLGHECHEVGHAGEQEACAEIYDECIAFCSTEGGAHHPEYEAGHPHDAGDHADHPEAGSAVCEELGHLCHDFDTGEGLGHECHEVGHAGEQEACAEIYDECILFCQGDGGHEGHGDGGMHSAEAGSDAG